VKYKLQDFRLIKTFFQLTKYWKGILAQKRIKFSHQFWTKPYIKRDCNLVNTDVIVLSYLRTILGALTHVLTRRKYLQNIYGLVSLLDPNRKGSIVYRLPDFLCCISYDLVPPP
jgi:hypothetical protein